MPNFNETPVVLKKMPRLGAAPHAGQSGDLSINNVVRSIGRGVPGVGSYLDEMNAATNAAIAPFVNPVLPASWRLPGDTYEERYNTSLAMQRGMDAAFDEQHPYISEGLQDVGKVASEAAFKLPSGTMSDIALGAAEGFGSGEGGFNNRFEQALQGAVEEALTGLGMEALRRRGVLPAEGGRKAGGKDALTRALLRANSPNGGGGW
ncbi:UNVERIFIED_ORG: hypothetical protein GGE64_004403 [Rhizobium etli]